MRCEQKLPVFSSAVTAWHVVEVWQQISRSNDRISHPYPSTLEGLKWKPTILQKGASLVVLEKVRSF
jgi:hypothetical protein